MSVIIGDCLGVLPTLDVGSVQCCVTSPPYFGLRDYGVSPTDWPAVEFSPMPGLPPMTIPAMSACLGLEPDPWAFVAHLVLVFREVRRVLADNGVCFVNLGDSYNNFRNGQIGQSVHGHEERDKPVSKKRGTPGLKEKDLIGTPWRFAFAAQADGWFLRQDVIWNKPNPMPESVRDRCTKAHEYLFVLTKRERYYWDAGAIAEGMAPSSVDRLSQPNLENQNGSSRVPGKTNGNMKAVGGRVRGVPPRHSQYESSDQSGLNSVGRGSTRNKRSVWTIATQPYSGAHFATFPSALVEPCIKAATKVGETVLDPFGGSGTVASVAAYLGRKSVLIDCNPANEALIADRMQARATPLFAEPVAKPTQDALL